MTARYKLLPLASAKMLGAKAAFQKTMVWEQIRVNSTLTSKLQCEATPRLPPPLEVGSKFASSIKGFTAAFLEPPPLQVPQPELPLLDDNID